MPSPPARIASLLSSATEMLFALGLGDRVAAVSHECDYPPEAASRPRCTFTHVAAESSSRQIDDQVRQLVEQGRPLYEVDVPLLARLQPDWIVTQAQCDVCAVRYEDVLEAVAREPALRGAAITALNPASLDDVLNDIQRLAEQAGAAAAGEELTAAYRRRIAAVSETTARLSPEQRPRIACLEWLDPPMVAGNWAPQLIDLAGGSQPWTAPGVHSPYVAWESIVAADPQVVLLMPCGFDLPRTLAEAPPLRDRPGWNSLTAVREGRVWACDGNAYFNRSGPRMIESLELLAHLLHPDKFAAPAWPGPPAWARFV